MFQRLLYILGVCCLIYALFFLKVGGKQSVFGHLRAIAASPAAQSFQNDLKHSGTLVTAAIKKRVKNLVRESKTQPSKAARNDCGK